MPKISALTEATSSAYNDSLALVVGATSRKITKQNFLKGRPFVIVGTSDADYITDGTADEVQVQAAIDSLSSTGGTVYLQKGTYAFAAPVVISGNLTLDNTKSITIIGDGQESTVINVATNVDGFTLKINAMVHMSNFRINVDGTGDGIASNADATNSTYMRSFWHSSFKNLHISGGYSTHTGWGMNLGSPFRSVFENIEIDGVGNGIKMYSEYAAFNPGDCVFSRIFVELYGNNGVAYHVNSVAAKGSMNQIVFIMCEAIASGTGCTGVLLDGSGSGGSNHNRFYGTNLEQFDTLVNVDDGEGNEFFLNYIECRGVNGNTVFKTGTSAWNNIFTSKYVYSANTVTLINDGNTATPTNPNIFRDIKVLADTGCTVNITRVNSTVTENIVTEGGGTVSSGVKKFPNVISPNVIITLTDGATPALDASLGNHFKLTAAGNRTIAVPTNPTDGQQIVIEHVASGADRTLALNTGAGGFAFGTTITALSATTSGLTDYITAVYSSSAAKWRVIQYVKGF